MSLKERITSEMKTAMKDKNADKLNCLRFLQSHVKNKEIEVRPNTITDDDVLQVVKKLVKQRKEGIEQFEKAGRQDLADKEKVELGFLEEFLPAQMSEAQVQDIVKKVIADTGASSVKDMGAVMKEVMARTGGAADGKLISQLVKSSLQ
ncbi:MAG: GatB/YqeY domain-containing protein [Bdellovibrionales bacterium]|nr:GatB/YqeY domain-containing protein [Bdellovibrionales bacterium]